MRFVILIYQGTTPQPNSDAWKALPETEQKAVYADYARLNKSPGVTPGLPLGLPIAARTVQLRDGEPQVKNGPHLAEGVSGYLVLEAETMEAAVALAAQIPAARLGGAVEIRPLNSTGDRTRNGCASTIQGAPMDDNQWLAMRFEESRAHLRAVAYRMLGSASEAEDAVQEAWLKLSRSDTRTAQNLSGWLTTIVGRVCLDMLRARRARREETLAPIADEATDSDPLAELTLADSIGPALLIVLDRLAPVERVAFVLHDMFDLSFDEIAPIVNRTPTAARRLASRARRSLRDSPALETDVAPHCVLVDAFLAASRDGDFERLVAALSPDALLRADDFAVRTAADNRRRGAPVLASEVRGASLVAEVFKGRAHAALPALIDGEAGAVWMVAGQVRAVFVFAIERDMIMEIDVVMDAGHLAELDISQTD
jgi:RNA polymerase sigma factor (sigma-70 family)